MTDRLRRGFTNLGLLLGTVLFFLLILEAGLRLTGFSYVLYPEDIEFGKPDPVLLKTGFLEDDDLFWVTMDYREKLDRFQRERPALILMGDSCTQLGTYDEELARKLKELRGETLHYGNLGVAGWTSHQGRQQLERDILPIRPRVVTIYYGWNDHWIGFGIEDKNVTRLKKIFSSRWSHLRTLQLMTKSVVAAGARRTAWPNRVSLADFRANLRSMVGSAETAGIRSVLLTAPTSIRRGKEPEYLASRWLRDLSEVVPLHMAYVETVREVAMETRAVLCDLEKYFNGLASEDLGEAFMADGIHLTENGDRRLASFLYKCLEEADLLSLLTPLS